MLFKVVLSWRHAINNMVINNWVTRDGHNISIDFRNFQLKSIEKLEVNQTLSYAKEIDLILCLSSIMYCNQNMLNAPKRHGMKLSQDH
ncbi:hypothetical protein RhiirB3_112210 [Rhizophagus irregularis]|nr:hypothetical protein RhiirB3_112210 [Rhizophagus irregularis]